MLKCNMVGRGTLIVVEGLDKSGKSTQCKTLIETLVQEGVKVKQMKFPDRDTPTGKLIDQYLSKKQDLDDHVVHLLFSANRWEQSGQMISDLNDGITLVVDRYAYSGAAYTAAKKGFDLNWCMHSDMGLPKPDLVLFFDLSASDASLRGKDYVKERYEKIELQKKVYCNFLKLKSEEWKVVDAMQTEDEVHSKVLKEALTAINNVKNTQIEELWMNKYQNK